MSGTDQYQPPAKSQRRLTPEARAMAMVRCRMLSTETWWNAVRQFLAQPETNAAVRNELQAMGIKL